MAIITTVPQFSKVLLATDFSEESERALAYAKSIVRASAGELLLVHVAQLAPVLAVPEGSWIPDDTARIEAEQRETEEAAAALRAQCFKVKAFCPFGTVGQKVAQTAEICHADLVVVGTHGRHGLNRLLFSSRAEETAGFTEAPLLIVGPRAPFATQAKWKPARILCATSMKKGEARLVAFAASLAGKYGASLEIVSMADPEAEGTASWPAFRESVLQLLAPQDADALPSHAARLAEPKAQSLIDAVIARCSDLLVVGADSQEWLTFREGMLQDLLSDLPCPILTLPARPNEGQR